MLIYINVDKMNQPGQAPRYLKKEITFNFLQMSLNQSQIEVLEACSVIDSVIEWNPGGQFLKLLQHFAICLNAA